AQIFLRHSACDAKHARFLERRVFILEKPDFTTISCRSLADNHFCAESAGPGRRSKTSPGVANSFRHYCANEADAARTENPRRNCPRDRNCLHGDLEQCSETRFLELSRTRPGEG